MSTLRILHLVDRLDRYGSAPWLAEIARHTPPGAAVHEVVAYRVVGDAATELHDAVTLHCLSGRWSWDPVALSRLARALRRPVDVIHLWDEPSRRRQRLIGPRTTPLVDSTPCAHDFGSVRYQRGRFLASHAGTVDELARQGLAADLIDLAPLGVTPPTPCIEARETVFQRCGWPPSTRLIVAAGPLARASRFEEAVWAYELVRLLHPDARLAIVGSGPEEQRLRRIIRLVSDPEGVQILDNGELGQAAIAMAEVYWQLDLSPTIAYELMAAMANGRCVVASETPAHRRVVTHEQTGYLVAPDSRTEIGYWTDRVLSEPSLREATGPEAAEQIRNRFDPSAAATELCEIYRKLVD